MRKRIQNLLLAFCLAIYILPISTRAATVSASVTLAGKTLKVSGYNTPAYWANNDGEASAEKWNAKLICNSGEEIPTLYLNGFVIDEYNDDTAIWQNTSTTAIAIPSDQPTRIVITGEDSQISTPFGITYHSNLEIISEGDAKLNIRNRYSAISSGTAVGCSLILNANLDLFVETYYDTISHILQTNKADLIINGGNIKISTYEEKSLFGIVTRNSGNIVINGGSLDVTSSIGAAPTNGSVSAADKLIINDGTVNATAKASVPLYGKKGVEIGGGSVEITSPYYGISAGTPDEPADITIKGGTVKITANRAFFTHPVLSEGVFAYAGADEETADIYDGTLTALAKEPWMLISNDPSLEKATEPTQESTEPTDMSTVPTEVTTAPTEAPTVTPTTAPTTAPTAAPTTAPTESPTIAPTEAANPDSGKTSPLLVWTIVIGAIGLVGIIVTLVAFPRQKIDL